jgi:hypothetical protein
MDPISAVRTAVMPPGCTLDHLAVDLCIAAQKDPCSGCNEDRGRCGGRPKGDRDLTALLPKNPAALMALLGGDLPNAAVAAVPGGIERQEAAGQAALVASTNMPIEMSPSREAFEALGFEFGGVTEGIFLLAKLPAGWTREATDHAMWSNILDEQGRVRVSVFYKAAFYDRSARARLERRYTVRDRYARDTDDALAGLAAGERCTTVLDANRVILHRSANYAIDDYEAGRAAHSAAESWLLEHFPDAYNPVAYWTDTEAAPAVTQ